MKKNVLSLVLFTLLTSFAPLPGADAVVPPPDGGYPNFTTAEGDNALKALTTGVGNTAIGTFSLFSVSIGNFNTAVGAGSLDLNQADSNTATGAAALLFNTNGAENTANGTAALEFNNTGSENTANGAFALLNNTAGSANTASGDRALSSNTQGNSNTAIGFDALLNNTTGNFNTAIGPGSGLNVTMASNVIAIGASGANVSNSCYIGNIYAQPIDPATAIAVGVDSTGKLGTTASSRHFKHDIKPMDKASEAILALKPVTFHYKNDAKNTPCFGLIAEEVAQINQDLVMHDKNGEILSVRYEQVNAMLLNGFLKEHSKVEKLEAMIATLAATVKEQAALIQKVSAEVEVSRPAPQKGSQ